MDTIFTIYIFAEYERDKDGNMRELPLEDRSWVDSYWTDEAKALEMAKQIWEEDVWECFREVTVFARKLNVSGNGKNRWKSCDKIVKRFHA
jgi:hypothetical protein